MKKRFKKKYQNMSLHQKLRYIILSLALPLVFCMIAALGVFAYYAWQYREVTHNVTIGSSFNLNFKENIDLKMYHYSVSSRQQTRLPVEDVEEAVRIAQSLKATTSYKNSRQALLNVLDYCDNLKSRMYMLEQTEDYDSRQMQLENNIYVLTNLIREKMLDYIYYEAAYLSDIGKEMIHSIMVTIVCIGCIMLLVVVTVLQRSFYFSKGITRPIGSLCENVRRIGEGQFQVDTIEIDDYEIAKLDTGIRKMAERISCLLQNVKQEEMLHHKMELQLLQAQINPHFLYNTLDSIIWMAEDEKNEEVVVMTAALARLLRQSISNEQEQVTVAQEIDYVRSYLTIQKMRYQDKLEYEIEAPPEILPVSIVKFTLQPLVENAIYHGIKYKENKGKVCIRGFVREKKAFLAVEDDGAGMDAQQLHRILEESGGEDAAEPRTGGGVGVSNVQKRLRLYYGEEYGISYTSKVGKGTTALVSIPLSGGRNEKMDEKPGK